MTNYFKKHAGLVIVALVSLGGAIGLTAARHQDAKPASPEEVKRALREKGIKEAARLKRHYVNTDDVGTFFQFDLDSLASHSEIIVTGTPTSNVCKVSPAGDTIVTEYSLAIQQVMKAGHPINTPSITVVLPGGRVQFEDGSDAETITPGFRKMQTGNTYVLFLTRDKKGKTFHLTGGYQGLFDITSGIVSPHGLPVDEVVKKHKGQDASVFVDLVDKKAKKHPETKECCFE
ncbi:MAG: hypothetical protein ACXW3C_04030 [Pyrinomonadaceae bacterium]